MSVVAASLETLLTMTVLAAIAYERMCGHGLKTRVVGARAMTIAVAATLARGWLAWRGVGGIETSIAFGIAAVAAITDLHCGYVFDRVLLAGSVALIAAEAVHGRLSFALEGGAVAAAALAVPWAVTRARGLGLGDVKLAGVLGCALGPYDAMRALWFAFVIGALVAVACIVTRRRSCGDAMPFAPFVALGAVMSAGSAAW